MISLLIISFILFVAYTFTAVLDYSTSNKKLAFPKSLSFTFYHLEGHGNGMGYIFSCTMFLCAFTIVAPWIEATPEKFKFLGFLGTAGIGFVGSAPLYREGSTQHTVHIIGAWLAALSSIIWSIVIMNMGWVWVPVAAVIFVISSASGSLWSSRTFWAEMLCFFSTYITLLNLYL